MVKAVLAIALALALPSCALAQAGGGNDSVHVRNRCRLAVQIITTGRPEPHTDWAFEHVRRCGREGAAAIAQRMAAATVNSNQAEWEKLTAPTFYVHDAGIFRGALSIAQDRGASTIARVYSMKVLIQILTRGTTLSYDDLTRGPGAQRVCFGTGPGSHHEVEEISPLPSDYRDRVIAAIRPLADDATQEFAIRHAATCVMVHARR